MKFSRIDETCCFIVINSFEEVIVESSLRSTINELYVDIIWNVRNVFLTITIHLHSNFPQEFVIELPPRSKLCWRKRALLLNGTLTNRSAHIRARELRLRWTLLTFSEFRSELNVWLRIQYRGSHRQSVSLVRSCGIFPGSPVPKNVLNISFQSNVMIFYKRSLKIPFGLTSDYVHVKCTPCEDSSDFLYRSPLSKTRWELRTFDIVWGIDLRGTEEQDGPERLRSIFKSECRWISNIRIRYVDWIISNVIWILIFLSIASRWARDTNVILILRSFMKIRMTDDGLRKYSVTDNEFFEILSEIWIIISSDMYSVEWENEWRMSVGHLKIFLVTEYENILIIIIPNCNTETISYIKWIKLYDEILK